MGNQLLWSSRELIFLNKIQTQLHPSGHCAVSATATSREPQGQESHQFWREMARVGKGAYTRSQRWYGVIGDYTPEMRSSTHSSYVFYSCEW